MAILGAQARASRYPVSRSVALPPYVVVQSLATQPTLVEEGALMAITKVSAARILEQAEEDEINPPAGPGVCRRCGGWLPESGHDASCVVLRAMQAMGIKVIWREEVDPGA